MLIQGGMGVAISDWRLARSVSRLGQLGVVSGTGISRVLSSRLMDGDLAEHMRRALDSFPLKDPVAKVLSRFYIPGGKAENTPYKNPPLYTVHPNRFLDQLTAIASYVEVFLAKEGHAGLVGINLLEKVQLPNLASIYGAMLAGVDFVLMGAGIPTQVASILDRFTEHQANSYRLDVRNAGPNDDIRIRFDPETIFPGISTLAGRLKRPRFLPIVSSVALAQALVKRSEGAIDGLIIEGPTAGGHNAPPRGPLHLNERGEPVYGDKDTVNLEKVKELGLPFWLAGGFGGPQQLERALRVGAAGVQVGTAFSLCDESGMEAGLKRRVLRQLLTEGIQIFASPFASPTGFPFRVAQVPGTIAESQVYAARKRICDLGFLRSLFKREDGRIGYRCPAEPVENYVRKGGSLEETEGRTCLCNNLFATAGFPQTQRDGSVEPPIVTVGEDLGPVREVVRQGMFSYSAEDVVRYILGAASSNPA